MCLAKVYHSAFGDGFKHVANVNTDNLDTAYQLTNSIQHHWSENDGVEAVTKPTRSTSVGDFIYINGVWNKVSDCGFARVNPEDEIKLELYDENDERYLKTTTINELLNAGIAS